MADDLLKDKHYCNWVRSALSLNYLKSGLVSFVVQQTTALFEHFKTICGLTTPQCSSCSMTSILPDHALNKGNCPYPKKIRAHCNCSKKVGKRQCPNGICGTMYDLIVADHLTSDPIWTNTDPSKWTTDHWEIAKCYLSTTGYASQTSANDIDATGLLSICVNSKFISKYAKIPTGRFIQARNTRNRILHSSTFKLEDSEVAEYIYTMIKVLNHKVLAKDESAHRAVASLEKLKVNAIHITDEDINEVKMKAALHDQVTVLYDRTNALEETATTCINKGNIQNIQERITKLERQQNTASETKEQDRQASELLQFLIRQYSRYFTRTHVSPIFPDRDVNVEEIYVPVQMKRQVSMDSPHAHTADTQNLCEMSDIFFDKNNKPFNNVYIIAEAGMGKTTTCKKIISSWCSAYSNEEDDFIRLPVLEEYSQRCTSTMKKFKFLFFVSLRYAKDGNTVEEIIKNQLLDSKYYELFDKIIENESEKCLIILDGLDEWNPINATPRSPRTVSGIPDRQQSDSHYCLLLSSRSWKMEDIRPKLRENDVRVNLQSMTLKYTNVLIDSVMDFLNRIFRTHVHGSDVNGTLQNVGISPTECSPYMLTLFVCLCHSGEAVQDSISGLYNSIIPLLLITASDRHETDQLYHTHLSHIADTKKGIRIPSTLNRHACISKYAAFLYSVGQFVYNNSLNKQAGVVDFDYARTSDLIGNEVLSICLQTGLMREKQGMFNTAIFRNRHLSLIHKSFEDYFVALYLCMSYDVERTNGFLNMCTLEKHIEKYSLILQFMCGIDPSKVHRVVTHIQSLPFWASIPQKDVFNVDRGIAFKCVTQAASCNKENILEPVSLSTVNIHAGKDVKALPFINHECVKRLELRIPLLQEHVTQILTCGEYETMYLNLLHSFKFVRTLLLKNVLLNHSECTNVVCDLPDLCEISFTKVKCTQDGNCGCAEACFDTKVSSPESQHPRQLTASLCEIDNSPLALCHVSNAPNLLEFKLVGTSLRDQYDRIPYHHMPKLSKLILAHVSLTHTQITEMICMIKPLTDIDLQQVVCKEDHRCGCFRLTNENKWAQSGKGNMKLQRASINSSNMALLHVVRAPALENLLLSGNASENNQGLENIGSLPVFQDVQNSLPILKVLELKQVQLNHTQMNGIFTNIRTLTSVTISSVMCNEDKICGCTSGMAVCNETTKHLKTNVSEITVKEYLTSDACTESRYFSHIFEAPQLRMLNCEGLNDPLSIVDILTLTMSASKLELLKLADIPIPLKLVELQSIIESHLNGGIDIALRNVNATDIDETYAWLKSLNIRVNKWIQDVNVLSAFIQVKSQEVESFVVSNQSLHPQKHNDEYRWIEPQDVDSIMEF